MDIGQHRRVSAAWVSGLACMLAALAAWTTSGAAEADPRWSARLGYARISFDTDATMAVAGAPLPGAAIEIDDRTVPFGDVGFAFSDRWMARLAVSAPIDLPVTAAGSLRTLAPPLTGTLGGIEVAPIVVSALYAPRSFGRLRPYVGAGAAYAWIREADGADLQSLRASSEWGVVVHAGCDAALNHRWSAFVDVRKLYVGTSVSGVITALGGIPVTASVDLDPLILSMGVGYRF